MAGDMNDEARNSNAETETVRAAAALGMRGAITGESGRGLPHSRTLARSRYATVSSHPIMQFTHVHRYSLMFTNIHRIWAFFLKIKVPAYGDCGRPAVFAKATTRQASRRGKQARTRTRTRRSSLRIEANNHQIP